MAGIFTAANIAAGASVLGTGASLLGTAGGIKGSNTSAAASRQAAQASAALARYRAQVARNNKVIAEQSAQQAIEAGSGTAANKSLQGAAALGHVIAAQGASGIDVNSGSNVDVQVSQRQANKLDTEQLFHNAMLTSYGYRVKANDYEAEARLQDATAQNALAAGSTASDAALMGGEAAALRGAGSILSNASSIPFKLNFGSSSYSLAGDTIRTAGDRDLAGYY